MTEPVIKRRSKNIDWPAIDALYLQGFLPEAISKKTGVNSRTISVHVSRHKLNKVRQETVGAQDAEALSRVTRSKLAIAADKLADCLQEPPKSLERQVLYADILQKNAKTASLVHGWGEGAVLAVVVAGVITDRASEESTNELESPTIDIEAV